MSSIPAKDVLYIDVDDEITTIIDKVRSSQSKILALVLPKRATTLQSIVNMKLLKRAADDANKHLVLITGEAGLMPLAANVGLYVAKTLQSKPEVPEVPVSLADSPDDHEEAISMDDPSAKLVRPSSSVADNNPINQSLAVGDLAKGTMPPSSVDDTIALDNDKPMSPAGSAVTGTGGNLGKPPKGKKNKKLAVPNFDKFRMWILIGAASLVGLIILFILCFKVLPHADILVKTDSTAVSANLNLTLNTNATETNVDAGVVPAQTQTSKKTLTQSANATGQKNNGQKASGSIVMSAGACSGDVPDSIPAGTGVSAGGLTFVTQTTASFSPSISGSKCTFQSSDITVSAQEQGAKYNIAPTSFSVAGHSDVSAKSSAAMSGGTDEIVKIVQQSDIDSAKQKLESQDANSIKTQLQNQLNNMGLYAIPATFNTGSPAVTTSAKAGDQADNVTVTEVITYSMFGAKQADLKKIIASAVNEKIDTKKQSITDYGLGKASFTTQNPSSGAVAMSVTAVAGPDLKIATLKEQVAGKKSGDAKKIIKDNPGVTDVTITYSPFWVTSIPGNTGKITLTIDEPQNKTNAD